ncbi:MAG TPA: AAA family ATPase, partial [Allocoleopsis sp.]
STLKYLPQKVGSELVPLLVDLQGGASATTLKGLAEYLASEIIAAARQSRNLHLPYPNADKLAQDPFPALQSWLEQIEHTIPGKRFLLCLDEYERLSEVVDTTNSRAPLNFLRYVLQHRRQWTLLFSGSHTLDQLPTYWSDYLINTRALRVSYLEETAARELIVQPIQEFPKIYEPTAVDAIINVTRCQPYLVQLMCSVVVDRLNRDKRQLATAEDVFTCMPIAIETGGMYFRELWGSLAQSDRDLLLRLIEGETPNASDKPALRRLIGKEVLEKTEDTYSFQVPLVQKFVEQVALEG